MLSKGPDGRTRTVDVDYYGLESAVPTRQCEHPGGRICRHVGRDAQECGTVLCIYNPGPQCFKHTPPRFLDVSNRRHKNNLLRKQKGRR